MGAPLHYDKNRERRRRCINHPCNVSTSSPLFLDSKLRSLKSQTGNVLKTSFETGRSADQDLFQRYLISRPFTLKQAYRCKDKQNFPNHQIFLAKNAFLEPNQMNTSKKGYGSDAIADGNLAQKDVKSRKSQHPPKSLRTLLDTKVLAGVEFL